MVNTWVSKTLNLGSSPSAPANIMVNEVEVEETSGCGPEESGFDSRHSPHKNKCPFCNTPCGQDWCSYD